MSARHQGSPVLTWCDFGQNCLSPKLSFSICCTRLVWTLHSLSWDTWLYGRGRQGLPLAILGPQYPVCPLGSCSASWPPSQEPGSPAPARRSPCSASSRPAWHRTSPALPQLPARRSRSQRSPRRLWLTSQWRRRAVAERFDTTRRLREEERVPSNRWMSAKTLLLLAAAERFGDQAARELWYGVSVLLPNAR